MKETERFMIDVICELSGIVYKNHNKLIIENDLKKKLRDIGCALMIYGECKRKENESKILFVYEKE